MEKYTVIGFYSESGQIFSDHVEAPSGLAAFAASTATRGESVEFVVAIKGHLEEDEDTFFPGESVVDGGTVESQPEVFGEVPQTEEEDE